MVNYVWFATKIFNIFKSLIENVSVRGEGRREKWYQLRIQVLRAAGSRVRPLALRSRAGAHYFQARAYLLWGIGKWYYTITTDFKICVTVCTHFPYMSLGQGHGSCSRIGISSNHVRDVANAVDTSHFRDPGFGSIAAISFEAIRTSLQLLWLAQFECHSNCKVVLDVDLCCFLWMHGTVITS